MSSIPGSPTKKISEWSWHLGGDSVETAGSLSKGTQHDSQGVESEEVVGGSPDSWFRNLRQRFLVGNRGCW